MALHLPVNLSAGNVNAPQGSHGALTTPTFTPAAGARLFVLAAVARVGTAVATLNISDTRGHDWQLLGQDGFSPPAGGVSSAALWTTVATGEPMQVTVSPSVVGQLLFQILPFQATSDAGTPELVQYEMDRTTTGPTWGFAFPDGPSGADSLSLAWVVTGPQDGGVSPAPGSGFVEFYQGASGATQTTQAQYLFGVAEGAGWTGLTTTAATKYGFLVELAEPAAPPEEYDGAAEVRGGGRVVAGGVRVSVGGAAARAGGAVAPQGRKASGQGATSSAGGVVAPRGQKSAAGVASVGAGGGVAAAGAHQAAGAVAVRGGGAVAAGGQASPTGRVRVRGGGRVGATGDRASAGVAGASTGGSVRSVGVRTSAGAAQVRGGGAVAAQGAPEERGAGAVRVRGGGAVGAAGARASAGGVAVRGGGASAPAGLHEASAAAAVRGGGRVAASGTARIVEEHEGAAAVAGGGRLRLAGERAALVALRVRGGGRVATEAAGRAAAGWARVRGGGRVRARGPEPAVVRRVVRDVTLTTTVRRGVPVTQQLTRRVVT